MSSGNRSTTSSIRHREARLGFPDSHHGHLVDAVGYLRPLLSVPTVQKQCTAAARPTPPSSIFTHVPSFNGMRKISSSLGNCGLSVSSPSPFAYRKTTPSPALTEATEPMSDNSFGAWSNSSSTLDSSFSSISSSSRRLSPQMFDGVTSHHVLSTTIRPSPIPPPKKSIKKAIPQRKSPEQQQQQPQSKKAKSANHQSDDLSRKSRVKTELCMHVKQGAKCPFGAQCTFAHSEDELKMTKLLDLQRAGWIDSVDTYRTKPCFLFVSAGSCPFGTRCSSLHDKRVSAGTAVISWLPVTETQGNTIPTDINVECKHQKRLYSLLHDSPFGSKFSYDNDPAVLYKLVCNISGKQKGRPCEVLDMHKVSIALQMQGTPEWNYKFRPQHMIHGELCMELQKRFFRLTETGQALEIQEESFIPLSPSHVLVREIAFGPDCDPSVRDVALWFNILDKDVTLCTPQQAKRFRWKRGGGDNKSPSSSIFDDMDCFVMIRPHDCDASALTTKILQHRLAVLQAHQISYTLLGGNANLLALDRQLSELLKLIVAHMEHWKRWAWPINEGRHHVDEETCVPPVDELYYKDPNSMPNPSNVTKPAASFDRPSAKIWESFVSRPNAWQTPSEKNRLPIFCALSRGQKICPNRTLPHILNKYSSCRPLPEDETSEQCWRSLLLDDEGQHNMWEVVREHFERSRSNKVLKILQQKRMPED
ncbi:zinc finger protein 36, C3H1 type-like [Seminavis robusta]|uniref:Zinc finger protein 36, C3H1 type-like n=1 Tax=Seminavis robusta TaxID=568900 RepID=A0A9N8HL64_9STRA|nr:zinc finger protein 36, C3H1 type-like [Seminavis robusta]|eukprot:Sro785_g202180.1 zinc finger protein 36, C3H1 type-like (704) ;mRNA; r:38974-41628